MKKFMKRFLVLVLVSVLAMIDPLQMDLLHNQITAQAAAIKLNKTSATVYVGNTVQLKVTGTKSAVTWKTNNSKIASVTKTGVVKGVKAGTTVITATVNKKSYTCKIKVVNQAISDKALTIAQYEGAKISIKGAAGDITWASSNNKVATVDSDGYISAMGLGSATITGTWKGKKYTCKVTIIPRQIYTTTNSVTCCLNDESNQIILTIYDCLEDEVIEWKSSDESIVGASWGEWKGDSVPLNLIPYSCGTATLTITSKYTEQEVKIKVTVVDPQEKSKDKELTAKQIYAKCAPSTVQINTDTSIGSGFFFRGSYIVTNYHVIKDASKIEVLTNDGATYNVDYILGFDNILDIAILYVDADYEPLKMNTHGVTTGETTYAIGSSLGLTDTFSNGIVTNPCRIIDNEKYIQTNASISHGNSGGPLLNAYGEVIGINTMYYTEGQNLNMAIDIRQLYQINTAYEYTIKEFRDMQPKENPEEESAIYEDEMITSKEDQKIVLNKPVVGRISIDQADPFDVYSITLDKKQTLLLEAYADEGYEKLGVAIFPVNDMKNIICTLTLDKRDEMSSEEVTLDAGEYLIVPFILSDQTCSVDLYYAFGLYEK